MKKFLKLFIAAVAIAALWSCDEDEIAFYKYEGLEKLQYVVGEEVTLNRFINELESIMLQFDGTVFLDSQLKKDVKRVVDRYDNGILQGTFYLTRSYEENGYYSTIDTYTLTLASEYLAEDDEEDDYEEEQDRYDFEYVFYLGQIGTTIWDEYNKCYAYVLQLGFGVPEGIYDRGISEFGIELMVSSGKITNKTGYDDGVHVTKNGSWTYFSGSVYSNSAKTWSPWVYIKSPSASVEVTYRWKLYDEDENRYVMSEWTDSQVFPEN